MDSIRESIHGFIQSVKDLTARIQEISQHIQSVADAWDKIFGSEGVNVLLIFLFLALAFRFWGTFFDLPRRWKFLLAFLSITVLWAYFNFLIYGSWRADRMSILYVRAFSPILAVYAGILALGWVRKKYFRPLLTEKTKNDLLISVDEQVLLAKKYIASGDIKSSSDVFRNLSVMVQAHRPEKTAKAKTE